MIAAASRRRPRDIARRAVPPIAVLALAVAAVLVAVARTDELARDDVARNGVADHAGAGSPWQEEAVDTPGARNDAAQPGGSTPVTAVSEVQGDGFVSPLAGERVTVEAVVTGHDDEVGANFSGFVFPEDRGIFVQEEPTDTDDDDATSEGLFVGIDVFPPDHDIIARYPTGALVRVTGRVEEKFGQTILSVDDLDDVTVVVGDVGVPPVDVLEIDRARAQAVDPDDDTTSRPYYESREGMLVQLPVGVANSGGTNRFGELFLTAGTDANRVFRTEEPPSLIATDDDAGSGNPDNPLPRPIDSTTRVTGDLFDTVRAATGPLAFSFGNYKVMVQPDALPVVEDTGVAFPYELPLDEGPGQLRLASFNVENYFPVGGELDLEEVTDAQFADKTARLADAIGDLLGAPAVVGFQEVNNPADVVDTGPQPSTVDALVAALNDTHGTRYVGYTATSNDERDIAVGFLVDSARVEVLEVEQYDPATVEGGEACSDTEGRLFDRPPLRIRVRDAALTLDAIVNHWASKGSDPGGTCRRLQSAFVGGVAADLREQGRPVAMIGDLNAFPDEPEVTTLLDGGAGLHNLWNEVPRELAYSFQFDGKLQTLDHILVSDELMRRLDDVTYAHFDVDHHLRLDDSDDGHSVSDHDPPIAVFATGG